MFEILLVIGFVGVFGWLYIHDKRENDEHNEILVKLENMKCNCKCDCKK